MTDHQFYNGNTTYTSSKPNSLNKSISAALSRENLHQYRRTEPKHLQTPIPPRTGGQSLNHDNRHNQPDVVKDYRGPKWKSAHPNPTQYESTMYQNQPSVGDGNHHGYHSPSDHHGYQTADALRRSQGTNTKHPQREFHVQSPSKMQKGEFFHDSLAVNGGESNGNYRSRESSQYTMPLQSRGVSTNETALEVINMNYNSIQQQMERTLLSKHRSTPRLKSEELVNGNSSAFSSSVNKMSEKQHQMNSSYVDPLSRTIRGSDSGSSTRSKVSDRNSDGSSSHKSQPTSSQTRSLEGSSFSQSRVIDRNFDGSSTHKSQPTDRLSSSQTRSLESSSYSQSRMTDRLSSSLHQSKPSDRQPSSKNKSFDVPSSLNHQMTDRHSSSHLLSSSQHGTSETNPKPVKQGSTSHHQNSFLSTEENKQRTNPEEVTRTRSKTPVEGLQTRRQISKDFSQRAVNYQQFTQDKVSPINPSAAAATRRQVLHGDTRVKSLEAEDSPGSRGRPPQPPPPHERTSRLTKENLEQLRKPRTDAAKIRDEQKSTSNPGVRQQPMGAEAVPRPATSMGFDRSRLPPHFGQPQSKEAERMALREKLQHLQRRKSSGLTSEPAKVQDNPKNQRWAERKRSYTTSTPDKRQSHPEQARPISRGADAASKGPRVLADVTNAESIRKSHPFETEESRDPTGLNFQERSARRWKEMERLMSLSIGDYMEEKKTKDPSRKLDHHFFSELSRSRRYISSSLDSLNQEATQHLSELQKFHQNSRTANNLDLDFQGTPQLSSPVDFDPQNPATANGSYRSSTEDLDLEVSDLLLTHPDTQTSPDPVQMALYQKLVDQKIHDKMSAIRDQRSRLEKKDGDLRFWREQLHQRMQDMLTRTNAVLSKSRSRLEAELREQARIPEDSQELTLLHALSTTKRPEVTSGRNRNRRKSQDAPAYANLPRNSQHDMEEYV